MAVNDIVATLHGRVTSAPLRSITSSVVPSNPQGAQTRGGKNYRPGIRGKVIRCHEFTAWQTRRERNLKFVSLTNK
jgi:hypothetical protein